MTNIEATVDDAIATMERMAKEIKRLRNALKPFVAAYEKAADPIGDSDLDNEQPRSVSVTLGDCRNAARVMPRAVRVMTNAMEQLKRTAAQRVSQMTEAEAKETLARIAADGVTMFHKDIRDLTGGYNSQSINSHVVRLLGKRAGYIRGEA